MLARNSLSIIITSVLTKVVEIIIFFLAVRKYLSSDFGYLTIASSFFAFFALFTDLNFSMTHVKKMAEKKYSNNEYFGAFLCIKLLLIPITTLVMGVIIAFQFEIGFFENSELFIQILGLQLISHVFASINQLYTFSFQAQMKFVKMQAGIFAGQISKLALGLIVIFFTTNFIFYVLLALISESVTFFIYLYLGREFRFKKPSMQLMNEYFKTGTFLLIYKILTILTSSLGPLIFANYFTKDILGVYYVIMNLLLLLSLLESAFQTIFLPNFSSGIAKKLYDKIKSDIGTYEKYMLIIWGLICIAGFCMGPILLQVLFGSYYLENGIALFNFLIFFTFSWALWGPFSTLLIATEDFKVLPSLSLIGLVCALISWLVLPPFLGIIAIEFGRYISILPNSIIIRTFTKKRINVGAIGGQTIKCFILGLVFSCSAAFIQQFVSHDIGLAIITFLGLTSTYVILYFLLKILNKDDVHFILEVINVRKFFGHVKEELQEKQEKKDF